MDVISSGSWGRVWKHAKALWPRWVPNDEQAEVWRRMLQPFPELRIIEALDEVLSEHPVLTPRLAWVLSRLRGSISDASPGRPQVETWPSTPKEADDAEAGIIQDLRGYPPAPAELREGATRWLMWRSGTAPKLIARSEGLSELIKAVSEKPYELWPAGLAGMVWAAVQAEQQAQERDQDNAAIECEEAGSIEVDEPVQLQQGGG